MDQIEIKEMMYGYLCDTHTSLPGSIRLFIPSVTTTISRGSPTNTTVKNTGSIFCNSSDNKPVINATNTHCNYVTIRLAASGFTAPTVLNPWGPGKLFLVSFPFNKISNGIVLPYLG
jgi:hypothetical protein